MLVSQIMQKDFLTVETTELIQEAASKMKEKNVGILLVLDEDRVKGVLTEKEITRAMAVSNSTQPAPDAIKREMTDKDEDNRCCYFNDVQVEILLGG